MGHVEVSLRSLALDVEPRGPITGVAACASWTILSQAEDADFTKLMTALKYAQAVYEAILGTTTAKLSLPGCI